MKSFISRSDLLTVSPEWYKMGTSYIVAESQNLNKTKHSPFCKDAEGLLADAFDFSFSSHSHSEIPLPYLVYTSVGTIAPFLEYISLSVRIPIKTGFFKSFWKEKNERFMYYSVKVEGLLRRYQGERFLILQSDHPHLVGLMCAYKKDSTSFYFQDWTAGRFLDIQRFEQELYSHNPRLLQNEYVQKLQDALKWQKENSLFS